MVDDELHIWLIGNKTTTFDIEWEDKTYTVDVSSLEWEEESAAEETFTLSTEAEADLPENHPIPDG